MRKANSFTGTKKYLNLYHKNKGASTFPVKDFILFERLPVLRGKEGKAFYLKSYDPK